MAVILEARNIVKKFNGVPALSDGMLICKEGKITGLLGANGSGKSTISKCIIGVYLKDSGTITYQGKEVNYKNPTDAKKDGISMAFQDLSLLPELTVWQNIVLGFEERRKGLFLDNKKAKEKAESLLNEFVPGFNYDRLVSELDPSEMQLVEIVKAISQEPKLLFLDEPTAPLERAQVRTLFQQMKALAASGVSIVFTSHRMHEVMEICDDVIVFRDGAVVGEVDFENEERDDAKIIQMITGQEKVVAAQREYKTFTEGDVLTVKNLSYHERLHNINLELKKGEVLGIGGLTGQGQEELLLALAGNYNNIRLKEAVLDGEKINLTSPSNAIRAGMPLVPGNRQTQGLMMTKSIYENSVLPKVALRSEPAFIPRKRYREEVFEESKILSTKSDGIDMPVSGLSGGNAQKVVLGKWLNVDMKVLLLADPAKGVDVGAKRDMYDFVQKLVEEQGISVILYASDNDELIENCDRVLVMFEGKIVGELIGQQIKNDKLVELSLMGMKQDQDQNQDADPDPDKNLEKEGVQ